jgi:hypothetical protein
MSNLHRERARIPARRSVDPAMDSYGKGYHVRLAGALPDPVLEGVDKNVLRSFAHHSLVY